MEYSELAQHEMFSMRFDQMENVCMPNRAAENKKAKAVLEPERQRGGRETEREG